MTILTRLLLPSLVALTLVACGTKDESRSADSAGTTTNGSGTTSTDAGTTSTGGGSTTTPGTPGGNGGDSAPVERKNYTFTGTVKKVDMESRMITLDHEKIGDWMEPMTMPFPVAEQKVLDAAKVGETKTWTVEVRGDEYSITEMK